MQEELMSAQACPTFCSSSVTASSDEEVGGLGDGPANETAPRAFCRRGMFGKLSDTFVFHSYLCLKSCKDSVSDRRCWGVVENPCWGPLCNLTWPISLKHSPMGFPTKLVQVQGRVEVKVNSIVVAIELLMEA